MSSSVLFNNKKLKQKNKFLSSKGFFMEPNWLKPPIRSYDNLNCNKKLISFENKNRSIIYQWANLITGKIYIGSSWNGSARLSSYWYLSFLKRNYPIYNNLKYYGFSNFSLAILEDLGESGSVKKEFIIEREQYYLNILFNNYCDLSLNLLKLAYSSKGSSYKLKPEVGLMKSGILNPMFGKEKSKEFYNMQTRNKEGINNPNFGKIKSSKTLAKLIKMVYVYNSSDMKLIGEFSTVNCSKHFNMGKDTLTKYIENGKQFKGKIFLRQKKS